MDFGIVVRNGENNYIVLVLNGVYGSGYNVVDKSVDPYNLYELTDVEAYCEGHPDMVFDSYDEAFKEETEGGAE